MKTTKKLKWKQFMIGLGAVVVISSPLIVSACKKIRNPLTKIKEKIEDKLSKRKEKKLKQNSQAQAVKNNTAEKN